MALYYSWTALEGIGERTDTATCRETYLAALATSGQDIVGKPWPTHLKKAR